VCTTTRFLELVNKPVHGICNERLLRLEEMVGESAAEITAHLGMLPGITLAHDGERICGKVASIVELTFEERLYALAGAVDITP
jgi:hypothetical protein